MLRSICVSTFPEFRPHPLLNGGHRQTIAAACLPTPSERLGSIRQHRVELPDGDQLVLHDNRPGDWEAGDRVALLIHGLCGCHQSSYMVRIAARLGERGVRTFRMDLRGCGAGKYLARLPYHCGQAEDARLALKRIATLTSDSPTTLIGFSLGGNITLRLLGEDGVQPTAGLDSAVAVNPPIDLVRCERHISRPENTIYQRYFVRHLLRRVAEVGPSIKDIPRARFPRIRRIREFDDWYTAPLSGFGTADNYYRLCSPKNLIPQIRLPTLIITAQDDPLVPVALFDELTLPTSVQLVVANGGGHLGYIAASGIDMTRHWLDWRVADWVSYLDRSTNGQTRVAANQLRHRYSK